MPRYFPFLGLDLKLPFFFCCKINGTTIFHRALRHFVVISINANYYTADGQSFLVMAPGLASCLHKQKKWQVRYQDQLFS